MNIQINKSKKTNIFENSFIFLSTWMILSFCFYFNLKFIDGNNFLDFMIFITSVMTFISYLIKACRDVKIHHNVDDEKLKQVELILNNK